MSNDLWLAWTPKKLSFELYFTADDFNLSVNNSSDPEVNLWVMSCLCFLRNMGWYDMYEVC